MKSGAQFYPMNTKAVFMLRLPLLQYHADKNNTIYTRLASYMG